jgi:uncharacterized protein YgiB involved in biofilm formation
MNGTSDTSEGVKRKAIPSKQLIVLLMSTSLLATSTLILYGCNEPSEPSVDAVFYSSVQQCIQDRRFTPQFCQSEWDKASQINKNAAPTYVAKEDCEEENEICEAVSGGSSGIVYRPSMSGYITHSSPYQGTDTNFFVVTQPVYGSPSRGYISANRTPIEISSTAAKTGRSIISVPRSTAISKPAPSRPVAKGGVSRGSYGRSFSGSKAGS